MNPGSEQTLVPPRPNLGPEPWTGDAGAASPTTLLGAVALCLLAVAAAGFWFRRRRWKRAATSKFTAPAGDESPEARLLALCEQLRAILSERFGPELHARTTEEIAADPEIQEALGANRFERLTGFLLVGDRLKFAGQETAPSVAEQLGAYDAWASALATVPARPSRTLKDATRRSPGGRTERRSPRIPPRRSGS